MQPRAATTPRWIVNEVIFRYTASAATATRGRKNLQQSNAMSVQMLTEAFHSLLFWVNKDIFFAEKDNTAETSCMVSLYVSSG